MSKLRPNIFIALAIAVISLTLILRPLVANIGSSDRFLLALSLIFIAITFYIVVDRVNNQISKREGALILLITGVSYGLIMSILGMSLRSTPELISFSIGLMMAMAAFFLFKQQVLPAIGTAMGGMAIAKSGSMMAGMGLNF